MKQSRSGGEQSALQSRGSSRCRDLEMGSSMDYSNSERTAVQVELRGGGEKGGNWGRSARKGSDHSARYRPWEGIWINSEKGEEPLRVSWEHDQICFLIWSIWETMQICFIHQEANGKRVVSVEYYTAMKKSQLLASTTCMNLKNFMSSSRSLNK